MIPFVCFQVNLIFLLNIIRVLVTKMRESNSNEALQVRWVKSRACFILKSLAYSSNLSHYISGFFYKLEVFFCKWLMNNNCGIDLYLLNNKNNGWLNWQDGRIHFIKHATKIWKAYYKSAFISGVYMGKAMTQWLGLEHNLNISDRYLLFA